jgi:hypothetical protein
MKLKLDELRTIENLFCIAIHMNVHRYPSNTFEKNNLHLFSAKSYIEDNLFVYRLLHK